MAGGARPGSGRKPQALAIYRLHMADWDAYHALELFIKTMEDEAQPIERRLECARQVLATVWGGQSVRQMAKDGAA